MPALRWDIDLQEIMKWILRGEEEFSNMMRDLDLKDLTKEKDTTDISQEQEKEQDKF